MLTTEQLEKIENAREVEVYYKSPYKTEWAIVRYYCRKGKPYRVAKYDIRGERLIAREPIRCFEYMASTNFVVVEYGFCSEEAATAKMMELRSAKDEVK
jgi:hypothetical protein